MKEWLFMLGVLLCCLVFLFNGCLMFLSPKRHVRFLDWLSRSGDWSSANTQWRPGFHWGRRAAGFAFMVFALLALKPIILWMLDPVRLTVVVSTPVLRNGVRTDWFGFSGGLIIFAVGAYMLIQPRWVVHWVIAKNPQRLFQTETFGAGAWRIRLFGALMMVVGVVATINSLTVL